MESLAYIHNAIAYEDPQPAPTLVLWQRFNGQKRPSSGWLKFLWIGVIVAATISLSEAAQAATVRVKTNSGNGVLVRPQPTTAAAQIGGLGEGAIIEIAASNTPGWYLITSGTYKNAYIDGQWTVPVSSGNSSGGTSTGGAGKVQVKTDNGLGMNVRSLPTVNSSIVGGLNEGEMITIIASDTPGWNKITEGRFAGNYVSTNWLVSVGTSVDPIIPVVNPNTEKKYVIRTNSGNGVIVRALPIASSQQLYTLGDGQTINAKASSTPGWIEVTSSNLRGGYIASEWAMPSDGLINVVDPSNSRGNYRVRTNSGIGVVVRSNPTSASANLGGLGEGSIIVAAPVGGGWLQIISGSYAGGYISNSWAVASGGTGGMIEVNQPNGNYMVNTNGGNLMVRSAPNSTAGSIGGLQKGQRVSAVASGTPGWLVINAGPYAGGYIASNWVVATNSNVALF